MPRSPNPAATSGDNRRKCGAVPGWRQWDRPRRSRVADARARLGAARGAGARPTGQEVEAGGRPCAPDGAVACLDGLDQDAQYVSAVWARAGVPHAEPCWLPRSSECRGLWNALKAVPAEPHLHSQRPTAADAENVVGATAAPLPPGRLPGRASSVPSAARALQAAGGQRPGCAAHRCGAAPPLAGGGTAGDAAARPAGSRLPSCLSW